MSNLISLNPVLRSLPHAANSGLPIHLEIWRRHIAEIIPELRRLSDLGDLPPAAHAVLVNDTLPPLKAGLTVAYAMARTAQDHPVMTALLRSATHLNAVMTATVAQSALTIRVLLASAADALVIALAEADPALWAAAAPVFDDTFGDGQGGAA